MLLKYSSAIRKQFSYSKNICGIISPLVSISEEQFNIRTQFS